jgi:integrase
MASIRHRSNKWQVRVSRIGFPPETKSFTTRLVPTGRRNSWILPATILSLETEMRRGELLQLRWSNIDLEARTARLPLTKNGSARTVPLSTKAAGMLMDLPRSIDGRVIPVKGNTLHAALKKACVRAGIMDFHWHDLRHTAITRLAEKLPNLIELAAVSGHRRLAMLKRYYHPSAADLARKIA